MILVDTSIWIDHLRRGDEKLVELLNQGQVLCHPFVVGELALGSLRNRTSILDAMRNLPVAVVATNDEVMSFIDQNKLFGQGIGFVDAHLLASVRLSPAARLWTRDKRLLAVSLRLGVAENLPH